MKPVLIVEGKEMEVITQHLINGKVYKVEVFENNPMESTVYYDVNYKDQHIEEQMKIDFNKFLKKEDRYEPIYSLIRNRIDAYEEILIDLNDQLMKAYKENIKVPFQSEEMIDLANRHTAVESHIEGLIESLGMIIQQINKEGGAEVE